jgi:hypothetical protein
MILIFYISIALIGMVAHWLKKWARGEITNGLYDYCMTHKKHTIGAICTMLGLVFPIYASSPEITQLSFTAVFLAGFGADSAANKSE